VLGSKDRVRRLLQKAGVDVEVRGFEESTKGRRHLAISEPKDIESVS
jgi:hypothetical protein